MAPQKTTLQEFEAVWPKLQESLLAEARGFKLPQNELEWYQKVCSQPCAPDVRNYTEDSLLTILCMGLP